jgi:4'-phosphopantetheinyl transferase
MATTATEWLPPPARLALDRHEVHIWRIPLAQPAAAREALWPTLAPDERERAERFHFARDRARFIVARGVLRAILGRYLECEPGRLRFHYNQYGKPALAPDREAAGLSFNLSHTHDLALYALARSRAIGVDVEQLRDDLDHMAIAEQFFSLREVEMLRALPPEVRGSAFFNCWTRKEAYVKARGEGLSLRLDQFDVSLAPGAEVELLGVASDQGERSRWSLRSIDPGPAYVAALAAEGQGWELRCWHWPGVHGAQREFTHHRDTESTETGKE